MDERLLVLPWCFVDHAVKDGYMIWVEGVCVFAGMVMSNEVFDGDLREGRCIKVWRPTRRAIAFVYAEPEIRADVAKLYRARQRSLGSVV
jgi:hypothetical protein